MSTRKKRPVLFEMNRRGPAPSWKPRNSLALKQIMDARGADPASPEVAESDTAPSPLFFDAGRGGIEVTLRWPALAILGAAALVLMLISFYMGQQFGRGRALKQDIPLNAGEPTLKAGGKNMPLPSVGRPEPNKRDADVPLTPRSNDDRGSRAATGKPAAPVDPPKVEPTKPADPPTAPPVDNEPPVFVAQRDMHYLVIQHFRKSDRAAAEQAGAFLRANGIECALLVGSDVRLVATDAFDLGNKNADIRKREEQRRDGLKRQVRELGKQYSREGGYAFDQPTAQKLAD